MISPSRLRRWFAGAAIAAIAVVAGMYFYARHRVQNALQEVPEKIGLEIQQSATGFTISKSEQGRTLFKLHAGKAVQFKTGGHAELHDVEITLYGRDSERFDQVYGADFEYDQQTGNVTAKGEVQIDLEANPQGLLNPDQAAPRELKNPIRMKTSGLVFNQKTGNAYTTEKVEFSLPQGRGSALGAKYLAKNSTFILDSQVNLSFTTPAATTAEATRATITKDPRLIVLEGARIQNRNRRCSAGLATLFLRNDSTLDRITAKENVLVENGGTGEQVQAEQLDLEMTERGGELKNAVFTGNVRMEASRPHPVQGSAGRVVLTFAGRELLRDVHAEERVRLVEQGSPSPSGGRQVMELSAPAVDFVVAQGRRLVGAESDGSPHFIMRQSAQDASSQTTITADRFLARFDHDGQITSIHGGANARITNTNPGQADRVSTSQTLDVVFHPRDAGNSLESVTQEGAVVYTDGQRRAWGDRATYTPSDQVLVLGGNPRVVDKGMVTTARLMRLNRLSGDATAEGDVKSTYNDLNSQPDGAILASSTPIHVTAHSMSLHAASAIATYTGDVRLWQDANGVQAPALDFDRMQRSIRAHGTPVSRISTLLLQKDRSGKPTTVTVESNQLTYTDSQRKIHFEGDVTARNGDLTIASREMDAFLAPRGRDTPAQPTAGPGQLEKIVASGQVLITQPGRRASGEQLVYTATDDKFALSGGSPSIFDAERGKITGVSLTFFRRDDRVLVEGSNSAPTVTQTQVAR